MLHYILQIVAFQVVFLLIYDVFLKRETFFNYNRIYLLGTAILSFILPFVKIDSIQAVAPKDFVVVLPEVIIGNLNPPTELQRQVALQTGIEITEPTQPIWQIIFYVGMAIATLVFLLKISRLLWLKFNNPRRWNGNVLIVRLLKSTSAFSFFNTIFIGEKISNQEKPTILEHELVHVKQWHSLDLMVFEAMRILLWFNPLIYMYQNRVKALHEFIADETAVKQSGKKSYYQQLLNQVFETQNVSFTNTFFNKSLIKKRIVMLQKSKSKQQALLKYVLLVPVIFGMLIYTSAEVKAQEREQKSEEVIEVIEEVIEVQEISEEKMKEKAYAEIVEMEKNGADFYEIFNSVIGNKHNYISTIEEYYRFIVYTDFLAEQNMKLLSTDGTLTVEDLKKLEKLKSKKTQSYKEYLQWKRTDEAKDIWENQNSKGVLKLLVNNIKSLTPEEEKRKKGLLELMDVDSSFTKLVISDGYNSNVIEVRQEIIEEDVQITEVEQSIEVPFSKIENPPTFPICEDLKDESEKRACTSKYIASFVNKNFNTGLAVELGLEGRQRIFVSFKINKQGKVSSASARAPHQGLEEEAVRVIKMLPKMIPGTQKGKVVTVPYSLPIIFQVNSSKETERLDTLKKLGFANAKSEQKLSNGEVPFSVVENPPFYKECEGIKDQSEKKKCTSDKVSKFVMKNFNTNLAISLGLEGRQNIFVTFKIDKKGNITDVKARGPHSVIEDEATRVIKMLPKMIPGKHNGKTVTVPYSLPIIFQVQSNNKGKN